MNTAHPAMNSVLFLVLRRMRLPLILLVVSYAVSILGMSLMPGVDAQGRPSAGMSLFHAFYFVSYTATTIGFGELPTAFSEAQRAWATLTIYLTVLVWLYSIGTILTLLQDAAFRRVLEAASFQRQVRRLRQPFYILCGCGETGSLLLQSLDLRNQQAVVLDMDGERISELELGQYRLQIPALAADVRVPANLEMAGLGHPACAGVVALTNDDRANLSVAVTTKLLRPELPVLARADQLDTAENMASFGTNQIVNGFELFGELLGNALHNPGQYLLYDWLTDLPGTPLVEPLRPPRGKWVICGYGRFGRAVVRNLRREQVDVVVIDTDALRGDCDECIRGDAAETDVQLEAGVKGAAAIVAGTDLMITGDLLASPTFSGLYYARDQVRFAGNATVNGLVVSGNFSDCRWPLGTYVCDPNVTDANNDNLVKRDGAGFVDTGSGSVTITYNDNSGWKSLRIASWRECRGADPNNPCGNP